MSSGYTAMIRLLSLEGSEVTGGRCCADCGEAAAGDGEEGSMRPSISLMRQREMTMFSCLR